MIGELGLGTIDCRLRVANDELPALNVQVEIMREMPRSQIAGYRWRRLSGHSKQTDPAATPL